MTFSRDDLYRRPNIAPEGTIPEYLRRPPAAQPPPWANPQIPPSLPTPPPGQIWTPPRPTPSPNPFPEPQIRPPAHEIDPPKENEFNDPDWNRNFLITLLATIRQQQAQSAAASVSPGSNVPDSSSSVPSGLFGRLLAQARDALESNQSNEPASNDLAAGDPIQPQTATDPNAVRFLVRR